ncbi:MAG: dCTP deaminase [Candidatus Micrarchaeota archaeon]
MILSDRDIKARLAKGDLIVEPLEDHQLGPSSLDVRLGPRLRVFKLSDHAMIDPQNYSDPLKTERVLESGGRVEEHEYTTLFEMRKPFVVHPHDFVLGSTLEKVRLPNDLGARLDGRSSLGRMGLLMHATAGWIDPGFDGHITLEITNLGKLPVKLYIGMRIGQLLFYQLSSPAEVPYNERKQSKYRGEKGATESKLGQDVEFADNGS